MNKVYTIVDGEVVQWPNLRECLKAHGWVGGRNSDVYATDGPIVQYKDTVIYELDPHQFSFSAFKEVLCGVRLTKGDVVHECKKIKREISRLTGVRLGDNAWDAEVRRLANAGWEVEELYKDLTPKLKKKEKPVTVKGKRTLLKGDFDSIRRFY